MKNLEILLLVTTNGFRSKYSAATMINSTNVAKFILVSFSLLFDNVPVVIVDEEELSDPRSDSPIAINESPGAYFRPLFREFRRPGRIEFLRRRCLRPLFVGALRDVDVVVDFIFGR